MFHIKICGVRLKSDVAAAAASRADAVGLNFFPRSVRYVDPMDDETRRLSERSLASGLIRVGVFVNESMDRGRPGIFGCGFGRPVAMSQPNQSAPNRAKGPGGGVK